MHKKNILTIIVYLVVIAFFASGCSRFYPFWHGSGLLYGQEGSDPTIIVIQKGTLYGYADLSGNVIIEPKYSKARPFFEGLAAVKSGIFFGYINKSGETVIKPQYIEALDFHNGKALVRTGSKYVDGDALATCAIIDTKGNKLKDTDYNTVFDYAGNAASVSSRLRDTHIILDKEWNEISLPFRNFMCYSTNDGMALITTQDDGYYFFDIAGNKLINENYCFAEPFFDGLAPVRKTMDDNWGYINKSGEYVIPPQYKDANPFSEGLACVNTLNGGEIIIDTTGKEICKVQGVNGLDIIGGFSDGLCIVKVPSSIHFHYGYIDTSGKLAIDTQFDEASPFKNGIAEVVVNGKIGYIDKTGKYIWEPK